MKNLPKGFYLKTPRGKAIVVFSDWVYGEETNILEKDQRTTVYCEIRFLDGQQMVLGGAVLSPKDKPDYLHAAKVAFGRAVKNMIGAKEEKQKPQQSNKRGTYYVTVNITRPKNDWFWNNAMMSATTPKHATDPVYDENYYWQQFISELRRQELVK